MLPTDQTIWSSLACPHCGQVERVQHVPAVYRSGFGSYYGSSSAAAVAGGHVAYGYGAHQGITVNEVASALAPAPAPRRPGGLLAASACFVPPLILMVWIALAMTHHGDPTAKTGIQKGSYAFGTWLLPVFFSLPVVFFLVAFVRRVRRNSLIRQGQAAAIAVWSQGWYCDRCGGAFFPTGTPAHVPTGQLLSLPAFRYIVWSAGGYANAL